MRLALAAAALFACFAHAMAGTAVVQPSCGDECRAELRSFADRFMAEVAPVFAAPAARFEADPAVPRQCPRRTKAGPAVYSVMMGPNAVEGLTKLTGPANDIALMTQVIQERGIGNEFITTVQGDAATREGMLNAMAKPLDCLKEGDQVVLVYTGWATVFPHEWLDFNAYFQAFCASPPNGSSQAICDAVNAPDASAEYISSVSEAIDWAVKDWLISVQPTSYYLPGHRQHLLIGSGTKVGEKGVSLLSGVTALELSNFVTQVRNKGADAFLIVDTRLAASGDLYALQVQASASPVWAADGDQLVRYSGFPPIQDQYNELGPVPLFGTGQYAALYASDVDSEAFEYNQGEGEDARPLGALIFRVAEVLRKDSSIPFRDMALAISRSFDLRNKNVTDGRGRQEPLFQTSNLDLMLLAPREIAPQKAGDIEIISPAPKRGAAEVTEATLEVVARYTGAAKARMAIIDGELVPVDGNGQFRGEVQDVNSKFNVALRVLGANYETLATGEVRLREKPAEPVIASPARRLALIIANDTYDDPAFQPLKTPFADATAVADVLKSRFGFSTTVEGGNKPLDLFLHNATKAQVQQVLYELRRRLAAEDQLIIYYAGHGEADPELGAYWVPVEAQHDADYSWIDATDITRELKRMNASSILVISDSCYSGGLARGGPGEQVSEARERYLAKASRLKARQLIASGGEEPVEDGGGGGHSVFAKALIEALHAMPASAFTASELLEQKVKPAVISAANALTEGQTPGFSRIAKAGDEPGSEFVFQAVTATP